MKIQVGGAVECSAVSGRGCRLAAAEKKSQSKIAHPGAQVGCPVRVPVQRLSPAGCLAHVLDSRPAVAGLPALAACPAHAPALPLFQAGCPVGVRGGLRWVQAFRTLAGRREGSMMKRTTWRHSAPACPVPAPGNRPSAPGPRALGHPAKAHQAPAGCLARAPASRRVALALAVPVGCPAQVLRHLPGRADCPVRVPDSSLQVALALAALVDYPVQALRHLPAPAGCPARVPDSSLQVALALAARVGYPAQALRHPLAPGNPAWVHQAPAGCQARAPDSLREALAPAGHQVGAPAHRQPHRRAPAPQGPRRQAERACRAVFRPPG
jgi:hypothetical protein